MTAPRPKPLLLIVIGALALPLCPAIPTASAAEDGSNPATSKETNRELVQTLTDHYLGEGDSPTAIQILKEHLSFDPRDASSWNLLGLTYIRAGNLTEARGSFEAAIRAAKRPDKAPYFYNLALVYAKLGDKHRASECLRRILLLDPDASGCVELALENLEQGKELPPFERRAPATLRALFYASGGYDTNVLLSSDSIYATSTGTSSAYYAPSLSLVRTAEFFGAPLSITGGAAYTGYLTSEATTFNTLTGLANVSWGSLGSNTADGIRFGWLNDADTSYVNSSGLVFFNSNFTSRIATTFPLGDWGQLEAELPFRYQIYARTADQAAEDNRSGPGLRPRIGWRGSLSSSHRLGVSLRYEYIQTLGDNYKVRSYTPMLQWTWTGLPLDFSLNTSIDYSLVQYPNASSARTDQLGSLSLSLGRLFWREKIFGSLDYSLRRSVSTLESAQYSKQTVSLGVSYAL